MRWSNQYLKTLREKPSDAFLNSHAFLIRAGYIYSTSQGIFTYNTLFLKAIQKLEKIIREEMEQAGAQEILMPMVQPQKLWQESGRWDRFEGLLQKMKNRSDQDFCLGPTHEEVIIDFVRSGLTSYKNLPFNLYQIQTKFRDEIRPRFGLMRAKEFIMKDAYSFDRTPQESQESYKKMFEAYKRIFTRLGASFVVVQADTGSIGGSASEEFHILADQGEDSLLVSQASSFAVNREICPSPVREKPPKVRPQKLEEFATPNIVTIEALAQFLKCKNKDLAKILFFTSKTDSQQKHFAILCQGHDEINPIKVKNHLALLETPDLASTEEIQKITGASPGSCGPYRLKKEIPIYLDHQLQGHGCLITGANKDGFHIKNVQPDRDFKVQGYGDFCYAKEGDMSPDGKGTLKEHRGIEVGHLFFLSDTYSQKMGLKYLDSKGQNQFVQMGCYGLGVTRTLQALIEQNHDQDGCIWPVPVAPCLVHICPLDLENELVTKALKEIIQTLDSLNVDYFIDDRKERPGVKFKDADLLGLPLRLNLGERDLKNSEIEFVVRKNKKTEKIKTQDLKEKILHFLSLKHQ